MFHPVNIGASIYQFSVFNVITFYVQSFILNFLLVVRTRYVYNRGRLILVRGDCNQAKIWKAYFVAHPVGYTQLNMLPSGG